MERGEGEEWNTWQTVITLPSYWTFDVDGKHQVAAWTQSNIAWPSYARPSAWDCRNIRMTSRTEWRHKWQREVLMMWRCRVRRRTCYKEHGMMPRDEPSTQTDKQEGSRVRKREGSMSVTTDEVGWWERTWHMEVAKPTMQPRSFGMRLNPSSRMQRRWTRMPGSVRKCRCLQTWHERFVRHPCGDKYVSSCQRKHWT